MTDGTTSRLGRARILAVDDVPANLLTLEAVLGRDYDMITARSGAEALKILATRQDIDVILLDIQMPTMDGYEVASRIKKLPGCDDIPIVFITAVFTDSPDVKRGYEVGGIDYFTKPFDPDLLKLKVDVYASFRQRAVVLKERERQVRESEEVLRVGRKLLSLLEDVPVGVLVTDRNGRVCQANEQVLEILSATPALTGNRYGEILGRWGRDGDGVEDVRLTLLGALDHGQASPHERVTIHCPDGSAKDVVSATSPLCGSDGNIVGAVIVVQDVTEHRQFEAELEQRITRLVSLGSEIPAAQRPR